jgi:hypothetical protein
MNIGSILSGVARLAGGLLPGVGPAGLVASLLLDPLRDLLLQQLQAKAPALPDAAAQALIGNVTSGFLEGLGA